jgi:hypothetical protein
MGLSYYCIKRNRDLSGFSGIYRDGNLKQLLIFTKKDNFFGGAIFYFLCKNSLEWENGRFFVQKYVRIVP